MRILAIVALAACAETVDVEPVGDYTSWPDQGGARFVVDGVAPGHHDTIRVIYVNPIARAATSISPTYPAGSIIVKEIRDKDGDLPGAIRYTAVMRQLTEPGAALVDEGGWLFTEQRPGEDELYYGFCWGRCHVAAPYNGAFYDYRATSSSAGSAGESAAR